MSTMADDAATDQIAEGDLVAHWLHTAQLGHAVDNFAMAGIVTPRSFAELPLNYYAPLGVTEPEDRKKLFFLVQKVKEALKEGAMECEGEVVGGAAGGGGAGVPGGGSQNGEDNSSAFQSPSLSKGSNVKDEGVARVLAVATTPNNKHDDVMSHVETTPLHEPISPVTMASPIASVDGRGARAGFFGKPAASDKPPGKPLASSNPRTPREKLQKELDRRARERQEEKAKATEAAQKSHATKGRRQSFLPSVAGSAASSRRFGVSSHRPKPPAPAEKKRADGDSSSSSEDELDSVLTTPTLKSAASRSVVDTRNMRRSSLHHRATVKKNNAARAKQRRYSSIPAPSIERDDDEDSLGSDTSDLSTSVASYRSVKGGCSSAGSSVGTHRSAASGISKHRKDETENRGNNVDQMRRRASMHKSKGGPSGGASIASAARRGKKPLSTMAEGSLAPLSPLPGLSAAQLDEGIAGASKRAGGPARNPARRRSGLGVVPGKRPGTADSVRGGGARPASRSSLGGSASSARRARPLRDKPQVASGSSVASRRIKSPVRREKAARSRSPPPSSRGGNRTPRSARSVSPQRSPRVGAGGSSAGRPLSAVRGPGRNRPVAPVRSPARSASRPRSPVRSPWNSSTRAGSPKASPKGSSPRRVKSPTGGAGGPVFVHGMPADDSHATQIAQLRRAFAAEHATQMEGREAADDEEEGEYEMRIRVVVRKRPMSGKELGASDVDVVQPLAMGPYGRILVHQPKTKLDLAREVETMGFAFDNVFGEGSRNAEIYERAVRGLIPGVFNGRWASVFAYGQTGSGKTFTMMGSNATGMNAGNNQTENAGHQNLGLYFLAARDVFDIASDPAHADVSIGVSLFEIYGGKLLDLLNERNPVKCLEDRRGKVCFPGLSEHPVESAEELMSIIDAGALNRSTGTTSANADSSRSHAVLQLSLRKDVGRAKNKEHGRLTFIDLAGSERGADTSKACKTTRMEGAEINTSLLALKEVIRALATGSSMKRIPFRGSKLTQVLKESFVGKKSRTVMVSCVAPNMKNCDHTLNTLRYADRVKERNPETGELSAAVAANSRIQRDEAEDLRVRVPPRPLTAPAASFRIERDESSDESEDDDIPPPPPDNEDQQFKAGDAAEEKSAYSEFSYDKSVDSGDSLEEVLRSNDTLPSPPAVETTSKAPKAKDDPAAQSLIATHKTIMSKLLLMLQHEMTLVNDTDANRDNIDEYLKELGSLSDQQLSLISTLRESLESYNESKNARNEAATKTSASHLLNDHSVDYDDDTFDLGG